ncbi:ABC-type branched-chain amino acid transport system, permease component [Hahella chejuensis KCTC 2396]|uniref:ABC-type branched-chain amino acid transport system, permease component n=1 Tax=Hahella chejuensis (strain KCTC 2396) TaxID=349521 RepID=Q2SMK2_HAHCH|nr:high-affinity branched-chain amino acid ABC transporter permease LivM [Hahella chejuensis]ABC28122.1 ABC-type branched-chain amino acid transport system, permease component [Hahella chejuensis KCTC 2396]
MRKNLPFALFTAVVTLILAFPILGLKLTHEGTKLVIAGASFSTYIYISFAAITVFFTQLFRAQLVSAITVIKPKKNLFTKLMPPEEKRGLAGKVFFVALLIAAILIPFNTGRIWSDIATLALIYVILGLGLNIVVGLAGLLDLGYVAFYAVGAYSYALLSQYFGLSFWVCLPIGALLAATFGFLLGFPVLRLRGDYLAIVTLGFGEIIRILLNNLTSLTGGPNGIGGIPKPTIPMIQTNPEVAVVNLEFSRRASEGNVPYHEFFGVPYDSSLKVVVLYLIALALALATILIVRRLIRMPVGRAWEALREDEIACRSLGLNRTAIKLSAFTIGAAFAGFAGSLYGARQGHISPESFVFMESVIILAIVVLGGMGSQIGVMIAAVLVVLLQELTRGFEEYRMLAFGMIMVLMMIWCPQGLIPMKRPHLQLKQE